MEDMETMVTATTMIIWLLHYSMTIVITIIMEEEVVVSLEEVVYLEEVLEEEVSLESEEEDSVEDLVASGRRSRNFYASKRCTKIK